MIYEHADTRRDTHIIRSYCVQKFTKHPKNVFLQMKTLMLFLKKLKWRSLCDLWRIWSEDFEAWKISFQNLFSSYWVSGNIVLLNGVEVIHMHISNWCSSQNIHLPISSSEDFGNLLQCGEFFSDTNKSLLVAEKICLTEELGFYECEFPAVRNLIAPRNWKFKFLTVDASCTSCWVDPYLENACAKGYFYVISCQVAPWL